MACSKCHQVNGRGGKIGPDLSNLIFRDYESVRKDIVSPNAALNPDHLAYNIELKNGEAMTGIIQNETPQQIIVADVSGASTIVARSRIASMKVSTLSLMPEGLLDTLSAPDLRDLVAYLMSPQQVPLPTDGTGTASAGK